MIIFWIESFDLFYMVISLKYLIHILLDMEVTNININKRW